MTFNRSYMRYAAVFGILMILVGMRSYYVYTQSQNSLNERPLTTQEQTALAKTLDQFLDAYVAEDNEKIAALVPPGYYTVLAKLRREQARNMQDGMATALGQFFAESPTLGAEEGDGVLRSGQGRDGIVFAELDAIIRMKQAGVEMVTRFPLWAIYDGDVWYIMRVVNSEQLDNLTNAYTDLSRFFAVQQNEQDE